ncbi:MAG: hypothetical protein DHS20C19_21610 [Acidimicrobiales bacterium]|nr:MAG: hypothetical protein DHS20C19_21610 [Acidimicrobiales bacterium]
MTYTEAELVTDHEYAQDHVVLGERLHGGFLADGSYQPPRALVREVALDAWETALHERGGAPFGATADLLEGLRMPTAEQQLVLLRNGLGQSFWNSLTIIGKIEARGRLLAEMTFPDLQSVIVEDISEMAIGHLNKGLLLAHGLDEGGQPAEGIGGHDAMWFAARDLAFGPGAYPDVEPPENIGREDAGTRHVPEVPPEIEGMVSFLANLLIIEFRAELGFADTQQILRTPDVFTDRRADAELAAEIVERIRIDEAIHVRSLNIYLGEMRSVSFRTLDGGTVSGADLIDRFWSGLVEWATVQQPKLAAAEQQKVLHDRIAEHAEPDRVLAAFEAAA